MTPEEERDWLSLEVAAATILSKHARTLWEREQRDLRAVLALARERVNTS